MAKTLCTLASYELRTRERIVSLAYTWPSCFRILVPAYFPACHFLGPMCSQLNCLFNPNQFLFNFPTLIWTCVTLSLLCCFLYVKLVWHLQLNVHLLHWHCYHTHSSSSTEIEWIRTLEFKWAQQYQAHLAVSSKISHSVGIKDGLLPQKSEYRGKQ